MIGIRAIPDRYTVPLVRFSTLPIVAVLSLVNTHLVVAGTGRELYGIVNTVATIALLLPASDLGVGAAVNTAVALGASDAEATSTLAATLRSAWRVLLRSSFVLAAVFVVVGAVGGWGRVLDHRFDAAQNWTITLALVVFALTVALSAGTKVLLGAGAAMLATLLGLATSLFTLLTSAVFTVAGAPPLLYAASGYVGLLASAVFSTVAAVRVLRRRYGITVRQVWEAPRRRGLLRGSGSMLVILIALPIALESGRLIIAHLDTAISLSEFSIAAQFYGMLFSIFGAFGAVLWREFVQLRDDTEGSRRLWRRSVFQIGGMSAVAGVFLTVLGPWASGVLSSGRLHPDWTLFAALALLLLVQCLHLPGGVLLTTPRELGWQSRWVTLMAVIAVGGALLTVPLIGPVGVSLSAAIAVLVAQFLPDLFRVRRLHLDRAPAVEARNPSPVGR